MGYAWLIHLLVTTTLSWIAISILLPTCSIEPGALSELSAQLRTFIPLDFDNVPGELSSNLFPWITDWKQLQLYHRNTTGIVIPVGDKYLLLAAHAISVLRFWNCTIPIEVAYMGSADLADAAVKFFESLPNTTTLDLSKKLDNNKLALEKWFIKPFSILYSSFERVLLMDADVVWLQDPMQIWYDKGFNATGTLFFPDRLMRKTGRDYESWFKTFIPPPQSQHLMDSNMFRGRSDHHQESGVVLIDKSRGIDGLLASCMLNDPRVRGVVQTMTFGEKETFWLGYEMVGRPYSFHPGAVGSIGAAMYSEENDEYLLCGHLAHLDHNGRVLWFNDGVVRNKHIMDMSLAPFTHTISGGQWHDICMKSHSISDLSHKEEAIMKNIIRLWEETQTKFTKSLLEI